MKTLFPAIVILLAAVLSGCASTAAAASNQATITFRYSHFGPDAIVVPAGKPITFTLKNDDPIGHEWIVGPPALHAIHRTGTDPIHDSKPDEVSVGPYSTKTTTIVFDKPGTYEYICHLPGHEEYGMKGLVSVIPT